ncbi:tigger transposable element-derived protein 4 [Papilio machaon]|uniref:tigger transposable element-derived protein 4 n=1 Tax=Papilio machaon TaxID=76193 RepID=UPI001E66607D|nr:tigger transposable element-derived protein 4 [Papilio machaon]
MASSTEVKNSENNDVSSDDEVLSVIKSKVKKKANKRKRPPRKTYVDDDDEEDDDGIMPHVFVHVKVEEVENDGPLDFSGYHKENVSTSPTKAQKKSRKRNIINSKKKRRLYECPQCDAVFEQNADLKDHSKEHQVVTRHKCEPCGRYFNKAFSLRLHSRVHMEKMEICPICGAAYTLRINMLRHLNTHEATLPCSLCPMKLHTKELLEEHLIAHETNNTEVLLQNAKLESKAKLKAKSRLAHANTTSNNISLQNSMKLEVESEDNETSDGQSASNNYEVYLKREDLSHATQCAVVSKMHKGRPVADICRLYSLTPEVVNEIWEDRDKYTLPKKAGKKYMNSILDSRIVEWFHSQRAKDVQVSGKMLQDIAESFAKESGFVAFNGSKKWLDRFKAKYKISLRGTPPKRDYTNIAFGCKWKNLFFKETWCDVRLGFADDDIYTADEIGFYYNPSKGRIKKMSGKKFIQGYVKDRLAIFLCANASGRDKRRLVVCGTEDPLVHSHRHPDTLPVTYVRHAQAHFTTQMFEEYVKYWNRELQAANRKAILVLDRATIHSKLILSNLKMVFVPWKASSGLIPVRNGIFGGFRDEFRRLILIEKSMNAVRGVDRNLTCLEALNLVQKAWERLPAHLVNHSFVSTGYDVQRAPASCPPHPPHPPPADEHALCRLLRDYDVQPYYADLAHLDMYLTVDEELLTGQGTNGSVFGGNHKAVDPAARAREREDLLPVGTERPPDAGAERLLTRARATADLDIVRTFLHNSDTPFSVYRDFLDVETFLLRNPFDEES